MNLKDLARRAQAARVWHGLSVAQVAEQLGYSDQWVYDIESGNRKRPPSRGDLRQLADALGVSEEWLRDGDTPPWQAPPRTVDEQLAGLRADLQTFAQIALADPELRHAQKDQPVAQTLEGLAHLIARELGRLHQAVDALAQATRAQKEEAAGTPRSPLAGVEGGASRRTPSNVAPRRSR